jgi:hypothetical protein
MSRTGILYAALFTFGVNWRWRCGGILHGRSRTGILYVASALLYRGYISCNRALHLLPLASTLTVAPWLPWQVRTARDHIYHQRNLNMYPRLHLGRLRQWCFSLGVPGKGTQNSQRSCLLWQTPASCCLLVFKDGKVYPYILPARHICFTACMFGDQSVPVANLPLSHFDVSAGREVIITYAARVTMFRRIHQTVHVHDC